MSCQTLPNGRIAAVLAATDIDVTRLIALARLVHQQLAASPAHERLLSITIHFDDEERANVARRYVCHAFHATDRSK